MRKRGGERRKWRGRSTVGFRDYTVPPSLTEWLELRPRDRGAFRKRKAKKWDFLHKIGIETRSYGIG